MVWLTVPVGRVSYLRTSRDAGPYQAGRVWGQVCLIGSDPINRVSMEWTEGFLTGGQTTIWWSDPLLGLAPYCLEVGLTVLGRPCILSR
jgi:hypothetical protein